ncbi:hypothetical protein [Microaceticoccus formicicus]|uniref:hypothetical protein n=1 Tax=Microaceticoccus formicicus TaxID=3118105 RepID=UPI003CD0313B|nr:hypothetical protein VZL98_02940 [Peptoniphilaceae bacterium AMB_02]
MKYKIAYIILGILLIVGYVKTRENTIDKQTLKLLDEVRHMETNEIWEGFDIKKYPLDVNYGNLEYRYMDGDIIKKSPDLQVLALTAISTATGPVVKVLPESELRKITDMGGLSQSERDAIYKSILIHEAFHCYQIEKSGNGVQIENGVIVSADLDEYKIYAELLKRIDNDVKYHKLWNNEISGLKEYLESGDSKSWTESRKQKVDYEKKFFGSEYNVYKKWTDMKELLEGSARYVENKALTIMNQKKNEPSINYVKGDAKFYQSGCLKVQILNEIKGWKDLDFSGSISLDELLISK